MSGRTNEVCATLSILAKSFLFPASQEQSGKQNPKLSAHPDGAVSPKLHLPPEVLWGFSEKKRSLYKHRSLQLTVLVFIYFLQGRKQMGYQWVYLCLIQGVVMHHGPWALPGKGEWGKEFPRICGEGYPTMLSSARGIPAKTEQLLRLMGWTRFSAKLSACKNPQETNRFAGYGKIQVTWLRRGLQCKVTHDGNMKIREQCEENPIRP